MINLTLKSGALSMKGENYSTNSGAEKLNNMFRSAVLLKFLKKLGFFVSLHNDVEFCDCLNITHGIQRKFIL